MLPVQQWYDATMGPPRPAAGGLPAELGRGARPALRRIVGYGLIQLGRAISRNSARSN